ncbi:MAG: AMP-binding protein, partial [Candidatus Omnitrophica bacterium]|nr:AMP-binding protein [Candidatus Omnitrophota bacterium]
MPFFLLHQKFSETADKFPGKAALQARIAPHRYKKYTYSEIIRFSKGIGFYFINKGIKKQDRIALILENGPEWPIFYFGILFSGAIVVPIDPQLTEQEIKNILLNSGAKFAISKANSDEIIKNLDDPPPYFNFPTADIDDVTSILYTSGTTATPKGVMLSHKNFSGNFSSIEQLRICNAADNVLSILPLHHSYPFMVTLLVPLCLGATVTYVKTLKPEDILSAMRETGVTILVGVPQLFYLFHKGIFEKIKRIPLPLRLVLMPFISKKIRKNFGSRLRFFVSGGARLEPRIAKDLSRVGFTILEGYGLTETSPVVTFNPLKKQKFGSVGIPIPEVEIKIANPGENGIGEVLIKGPNVMKGYYKRQQETGEVIEDGWFHSGDLGYIDKEGYLFLTGRQKEIIVLSSGKNIYPEEIEAHYQKSLFIKEVCVLGVLKGGFTEELGAIIVPDIEYFKKVGVVNVRQK